MSDAEVEEYLKRCEDAAYEEMAIGEAETGCEYSWCVAHHTFTNPIVMRRVINRRVAEGKKATPMIVFCHGTALKMYSNELKGLPDYPSRFKPLADREGIFNDLSTGAKFVITISEANKKHFLDIFPEFPAERCFVSMNGYNPLVFFPRKDATLAQVLSSYTHKPYNGAAMSIPGDKFSRMVLFVGKFADWKRLDAVLFAAAKYESQYPDVATIIVGTGQPSDVKLYQDMALETLKLKRTFFLGAQMQPDLCKLASVANIGVFPSWKEPFGMVFIECMACGTPVIGAKSGGPLMFVDDSVGELVPENDDKAAFSDALCGTITRSLDENWKASKGPACLKKTEAFSMNQQCREIVGAVENMVKVNRLIFQLGTNNWQTIEEPAPGSGILHEAHHLAYNTMPGTACYSVYPSSVHSTNPGREKVKVIKLPHKIPICESISPVSDKRWHSMSDAEVEEYLKRCEDAAYEEMAIGEAETGCEYSWCVAHHTFTNPIVMRRVINRRVAEGKKATPMIVFCHGTALKMYSNELKGLPDYPSRFKPLADREGIFNDLSTGAKFVITISEANKKHFLDIFPEFPAERCFVSMNGYNPLVFFPRKDATLAQVLSSYTHKPYNGAAMSIPGDKFSRMVLFVGKFADWKRLDAVLFAAAKYESQYPDVATIIVGTGQPSDVKLYQDMALETLKLKRTFFLGAQMQPDLCKLASVANIGVFPSWKEPFGMVFIECMACGTPVIGAKSGGPLMFVDDSVGELVPENDDKAAFSDALCGTITRSLDENWKASKGPACLKKTEAFSMNQQCREIVGAIRDTIGAGPPDPENFTLSDGRVVKVLKDEAGIGKAVCDEVVSTGSAAIKAKGAFSICIPGGSIVAALANLPKDALDFSKVHVFFCNERIGEGKCYKGALKNFIEPFGIPQSQVHKVGEGTPEAVAAAYTALLKAQPESIVAKSASGLPSVDLVLLGTGEDGHVGSLHPNKQEIRASGNGVPILSINEGGKTSIAVSMDFIRAAKKVVLSAAKKARSPMVARCLRSMCGSYDCPASMVNASSTTWLCDQDSISDYRAKAVMDAKVEVMQSFWEIPGMKAGVLTGDLAWALLRFAKAKGFAIPAFNCTSTSSVNAVLEAGKKLNRPVMVQFSEGGSAFFAGKGLPNNKKQASILGAVCGAHYVRSVAPAYGIPVLVHSDHCAKKLLPWFDGMLAYDEHYFKATGEPLFSSHMLDLSEEDHEENIGLCRKYLQRMAPMNLILEMEIGITGGVEDGVDNSGISKDKLYSTPEDVWQVWEALAPISEKFTIAAAFGNVHGVYKPGNVHLRPELLQSFQTHAGRILGVDRPFFFVFHGGSGSEKEMIDRARSYGVVKMNVDTDTQWAYWVGVKDFYEANEGYLQSQIGNPKGVDKPNKNYYDPRKWVRESEITMCKRVEESCKDLKNV